MANDVYEFHRKCFPSSNLQRSENAIRPSWNAIAEPRPFRDQPSGAGEYARTGNDWIGICRFAG